MKILKDNLKKFLIKQFSITYILTNFVRSLRVKIMVKNSSAFNENFEFLHDFPSLCQIQRHYIRVSVESLRKCMFCMHKY